MRPNLKRKTSVFTISPFYLFDQKHLFKLIQIFLRIYPFSNLLKKKFLSISVLVSGLKIEVHCAFPRKPFKTTEKTQFSCMSLTLGRKTFFINISPILLVCSKSWLNKSKFSSGFVLFKHVKKNIVTEYLSAPF